MIQVPSLLRIGGGRSIVGSAGGRPEEAINFSVLFGVIPMVEVFPLEQAALGCEKMLTAKVHFRSVLKWESKYLYKIISLPKKGERL
jgi:D-arabinose 1-dehydrogenase-like Zn-dependent alcohol dehydrogenase